MTNVTTTPVTTEAATTDYGLCDNIQDGVTLHCFNWKYNDIKAELPNIAAAGFTSVQTSPAQRDDSYGVWYMLYQPQSFSVSTNALGTKAELQSLCEEADKYGIKVIVDVVANHMRGDGYDVDSSMSRSSHNDYWHHDDLDSGRNIDWTNRYHVTHGRIGMYDLNSENSDVQNIISNYIKELQSIGVDGIRWDAAKHIGLPSEGCNFWPAVTSQGLYHYGEILKGPDDRDSGNESLMVEYSKYMTVTDSDYGKTLRDAFASGTVPTSFGNWAARGVSNSKLIYWGESHDTWSNNQDWGYSNGMSQNVIDRAYAVAASRNQISALYFSRPASANKESIRAGQKGSTHFTSPEVAEVNHFHNAMNGQADYYTTGSNCAVVCRQTGAVVVAGSGSNFSVTVPNGGSTTQAGTYVDAITGEKWTVTSTTMSGKIGSSGIAVLYKEGYTPTVTPTVTPTPGDDDDWMDLVDGSYDIYFHKPSGWGSTIYCYAYEGETSSNGTWPGVKMTNLGQDVYAYNLPSGWSSAQVIFSDGSNQYPASMEPGLNITDGTSMLYNNGSWSQVAVTTPTVTPTPTVTVTPTPTPGNDWSDLIDGSYDVYFYNSLGWSSTIYCYAYESGTSNNGTWPGVKMTSLGNGLYAYNLPDSWTSAKVIFSDGTNQYPSSMEPGLDITNGTSMLYANGSWSKVVITIPDLKINSFTANKTSPQTTGTSVTFTASAEGGKGTLQYRFRYTVNGTTTTFSDYSTSSTASCNPGTAGTYTVYVDVKDENGTVETTSMKYTWETASNPITINSFTANKTSPQTQGTSVKFTVNAEGGDGTLQYRFYRVINGTTKIFRDYTTSNSAYCNPPIGDYTIYVDVKDENGNIQTVSMKYTWKAASNPLTINSFTVNKISPQTKGTTVKFTVDAEGGDGTLQYCFYRVINGTTKVFRDYSTTNTAYCNPSAGTYTIFVDIKDETGKVVTASMKYTWTAGDLTINSFTANKTSPQAKGTSVKFTVDAEGDGTLQYRFYRVINGTTKVFRDYSTSNSAYCNPPAGTYTIYVDVKDSSGNIVTSKMNYTWK